MSRPVTTPGPARMALVAGARLPLAFISFGLMVLAVAVTMLAAEPGTLLMPFMHPRVVAFAHLFLPGFLLSVTIGALYQLMPVVLGAPLGLSERVAWVHFALHGTGVTFLVAGFFASRFEVVALGGAVVTAGIAILLVAAWRTFRGSARRDAIAWSFPISVSWLAATVSFGVLVALNRRSGFLPLGVVQLLRAHAHLGLVGFFLTLLQGATFQLVPMFTMADLRRPGAVKLGLIGSQAGLLLLVPGLATDHAVLTFCGAVVLVAGIATSGVALQSTYRSRRRRELEPGLAAFALGATLLGCGAIGGLVQLAAPPGSSGAVAYGVVIIAGALSLMVLGMLCKIVPFLVWMKVYGPRVGRQPVPLATTLGLRAFEWAWLGLHGAAIALLAAGTALGVIVLVGGGMTLLAAAVLVFLANVVRVMAHIVRPQPGAAPTFKPAISS